MVPWGLFSSHRRYTVTCPLPDISHLKKTSVLRYYFGTTFKTCPYLPGFAAVEKFLPVSLIDLLNSSEHHKHPSFTSYLLSLACVLIVQQVSPMGNQIFSFCICFAYSQFQCIRRGVEDLSLSHKKDWKTECRPIWMEKLREVSNSQVTHWNFLTWTRCECWETRGLSHCHPLKFAVGQAAGMSPHSPFREDAEVQEESETLCLFRYLNGQIWNTHGFQSRFSVSSDTIFKLTLTRIRIANSKIFLSGARCSLLETPNFLSASCRGLVVITRLV